MKRPSVPSGPGSCSTIESAVSPLPKPSSRPPRIHLLRVENGPENFGELIAAARELGLRVGWLDLAEPVPLPAGLETAAAAGALRAVAVGGGRSAAVKPLRGAPVLSDLLREHFRGCALVLIRGEIAGLLPAGAGEVIPRLAQDGESWRIAPSEASTVTFTTAALAAALRRPRPW
jgi:hypothetical protein